jgi:DNA-binding CsgD family transcriptional regulator
MLFYIQGSRFTLKIIITLIFKRVVLYFLMLNLEPLTYIFLYLFSIGMGIVLFYMIQLPGKNALTGKLILGVHVASYMLAISWDVINHFEPLPYFTRFLISSLYWTGPSLLWLARWGMNKRTVTAKNLRFNLIGYSIYLSLLLFNNSIFSSFYKRLLYNDVLILGWIFLNGGYALWTLRSKKSIQIRISCILITILIMATICWGIVTALNDRISLFFGLVYILIVLLGAQAVLVFLRNKRNKIPIESQPDTKNFAVYYNLTAREIQVLNQLGMGAGNKDIATTLNISEHTVKRHISNLFKKCGVSSRYELAVLFMGWKPLDTKVPSLSGNINTKS